MKKSRLFAFIAAIILIVALSYFVKRSPPGQHASNTEQAAPPPQKLNEQLKNFSGLDKSTLSDSEKATACGAIFEKLEIYSLKTLTADLLSKELVFDPSCFQAFIEKYPFLKGFPETCQLSNEGKLVNPCPSQLLAIKAIRIHTATQSQSTDSLSTDLLINRLFALLTNQSIGTPEGTQAIKEVGQELFERMPNNESAAKAAGLGYLVDDHLSPEDQQRFSDLGSEIRNRFPDNWEIYEINLVSKRNINNEEFENTIKSTYESNPESAIANYYMGCAKWKYKAFNEARAYFQKALQLSPHHERFAQTLKDSSDTNNEKVCRFEIGFNPDNF